MQVRTQRELIETVVERWREAYYSQDTCLWYEYDPLIKNPGNNRRDIYNELAALKKNNTLSAIKIELITGSKSWTNWMCDCCWNYKPNVVQTVKAWDEKLLSSTCFDCATNMCELINQSKHDAVINQFYGADK